MSPDDYVEQAIRTESPKIISFIDSDWEMQTNIKYTRLLHASMGLCTEAAEFQDALKKTFFYNKPLDLVNLKEELGDLFWYIAIACDALEISFNQIMNSNIAKLRARYPDKFTSENAINRDLNVERAILEEQPSDDQLDLFETKKKEINPKLHGLIDPEDARN